MQPDDVVAWTDALGPTFAAVAALAIIIGFLVPILRRESKGEKTAPMVTDRELIEFMTETRNRLDRLEAK